MLNKYQITQSVCKALVSIGVVTALSLGIQAPHAEAIGKFLFHTKAECEADRRGKLRDPSAYYWAKNLRCHWHPELDHGRSMWWLY